MSVVKKLIVSADAECRYLSPGELDQILIFAIDGDRHLRLAKILTEGRVRIVKQAGNQLFQRRPSLVAPGGNAYGSSMTATCLRDLDYYLRLITYSVVAGTTEPLQEIGVMGASQMYHSLGTPMSAVADGVRAMQQMTTSLMSGEDAQEISTYFDYLIHAFE